MRHKKRILTNKKGKKDKSNWMNKLSVILEVGVGAAVVSGGLQIKGLSNWSWIWGVSHPKMHLITQVVPILMVQNLGLKHQSFHFLVTVLILLVK